ncbi:GmrSD restriction endonuclease domain-containing protein [Ramlibacter albus]|uniref:DUF262 domain-containing protein n=1 Tax=Ramlibacter albus TaxID=2079448 RepID=A0A923M698_9BURK|nr:DUF262 domain-containing protein [Ramlibacter albus]MBC5764581.1 DUF262 domain-containing protein [Ramlibacter albus]
MSTFDSTKRLLPDILSDIVKGKIQLPDFQRGWVWDDDHIRSLLVSIARSFPVGAVMLLETGGEAKFQLRPIEGVGLTPQDSEAELLILDGQQRLTTLTQVLALKSSVKTRTEKGKPIERHYYWDISKALDGTPLEDAIVAVEADHRLRTNFGKEIKLDLSSTELECEQLHFPCDQTLKSDAWESALIKISPEKFMTYMKFRESVLDAFRNYQLPVIQLHKSTSKEAVCLVFEKVNTGGVPLNVFELVTATYAADGYNLRDDWYGSAARKVSSRQERLRKEPVLEQVETTDFLQAITMLQTLELRKADLATGKTGKQVTPASAKRASILMLELGDYKKWAGRVERGFLLAAKFLRKEQIRDPRELPYRTQLAPLAAVLALLEERWLEPVIQGKLSRWYWCGVLGELYGGAVETRIANDVEELLQWILDDGPEPRTIRDASFSPDRLDRITSRLSAAYKGINMLVLREGAADFFWKAQIKELEQEEINLDIHHIFPQIWCENAGIKRATYNAIVNKTPISYKANRMIGGSSPSSYLRRLQDHKQVQLSDIAMNELLSSHCIDPAAMRSDNFNSFYQARKKSLLALIERAMGKSPVQGSVDESEFDDAEAA